MGLGLHWHCSGTGCSFLGTLVGLLRGWGWFGLAFQILGVQSWFIGMFWGKLRVVAGCVEALVGLLSWWGWGSTGIALELFAALLGLGVVC